MKEVKTNVRLELEAAAMVLVGSVSLVVIVFLLSELSKV